MNARKLVVAAVCVLPMLAYGFDASVAATASAPAAKDQLLAQLTGVPNVYRSYPWLVTGGQPGADALEALGKAGFRDIYDLRGADEPRGFDEPAVVRSLKLRYWPIPTAKAALDDSRFTAIRHHLVAHGPEKPMFIHCASGNRVGAALLPWLVLDEGLSEERALETARAMGLQDPELTKRALDYIRAHWRPKQ